MRLLPYPLGLGTGPANRKQVYIFPYLASLESCTLCTTGGGLVCSSITKRTHVWINYFRAHYCPASRGCEPCMASCPERRGRTWKLLDPTRFYCHQDVSELFCPDSASHHPRPRPSPSTPPQGRFPFSRPSSNPAAFQGLYWERSTDQESIVKASCSGSSHVLHNTTPARLAPELSRRLAFLPLEGLLLPPRACPAVS